MISRRTSAFPLVLLGAATWILLDACGGRTVLDGPRGDPDGSDTSGSTGTSTGTTVSSGASGVTTGSTGPSGVTTTVGTGPGTGAGGSSGCDNIACNPIACPPGSIVAFPPGACCPICMPCDLLSCVVAPCPSGSHLETPPRMCCSICVPNPPSACEQGQKAYSEFRAQIVQKYQTIPCQKDTDCVSVFEFNRCASSCAIAVASSEARSLNENLSSFAAMSCSTCPPQPPLPCVPTFVSCLEGQCALGLP